MGLPAGDIPSVVKVKNHLGWNARKRRSTLCWQCVALCSHVLMCRKAFIQSRTCNSASLDVQIPQSFWIYPFLWVFGCICSSGSMDVLVPLMYMCLWIFVYICASVSLDVLVPYKFISWIDWHVL